MLALWRGWFGFVVPVTGLWFYAYISGYHRVSVPFLAVVTAITAIVQLGAWVLARKYRDGNLAYTGAGVTGFATGILSSMMLGPFLGFFAWWGMIGQVAVKPLGLGLKPIMRSFAGGVVKFLYGIIITGFVSARLF